LKKIVEETGKKIGEIEKSIDALKAKAVCEKLPDKKLKIHIDSLIRDGLVAKITKKINGQIQFRYILGYDAIRHSPYNFFDHGVGVLSVAGLYIRGIENRVVARELFVQYMECAYHEVAQALLFFPRMVSHTPEGGQVIDAMVKGELGGLSKNVLQLWEKYSVEYDVMRYIRHVFFYIFINADVAFDEQKSVLPGFFKKSVSTESSIPEEIMFFKKVCAVLIEQEKNKPENSVSFSLSSFNQKLIEQFASFLS